MGIVIDFTDPSTVYENVKQVVNKKTFFFIHQVGKVKPSRVLMIFDLIKATAFGMKSVVYVPRIKPETVSALSALCDKATMVSTG